MEKYWLEVDNDFDEIYFLFISRNDNMIIITKYSFYI